MAKSLVSSAPPGVSPQQINARIRPAEIIGTTGLKEFSGFIDEEFLNRLRGQNAVKLYREMNYNSPILAAATNLIKWLIRQVTWRIEPANDSNEALREAEETDGALEDMSHTWEDMLSEVLSFVEFGWAYFETVYKLRRGPSSNPTTNSKFKDGKWGWRKFEIRGQETLNGWAFDDEGGLLGMVQLDPLRVFAKGPVFIPIDKSLLFRTQTFKGNPEGLSLYRPAVIPYYAVKRIQEFEITGSERDLAGMPLYEVPPEMLLPGATPDQVTVLRQLERFVTGVRRDERWGGVIPAETDAEGKPTGFKFRLATTGGRRQIDTDKMVKRYDSRMLMLFLAQFLVLGQDGVGARAVALPLKELFGVGLNHLMDIITSVFNRFAIRRRQALNGVAPELDPKLVHGEVEKPNLDELGKYVTALASAGALPADPAIERKLLEIGDLPQPAEDKDDRDVSSNTSAPTATSATVTPAQVGAVLQANKALKDGTITRKTAVALVAEALGVDRKKAAEMVG